MSPVRDALAPFLESSALLHALDVDPDGIVEHANAAAAARFKLPRRQLAGTPLAALVATEDRDAALRLVDDPQRPATLHFVSADGVVFPLSVHAIVHDGGALLLGEPPAMPYLRLGDTLFGHVNELAVQARERVRRARSLEREPPAHESAHWHLARDREILPLCTGCARVQSPDAGWEEIGDFLRRSADVLGGGYCEQCAPEVAGR